MKKIGLIAGCAFLMVFLIRCSTDNKKDHVQQIAQLEQSLFSEEMVRLDMNKANELITAYVDFADNYPDDDNAAGYLFKAADMCMNLGKPQMAVQLYDRILNDYPGFEKSPQALFLKGYVYENLLVDLESAKKVYEEFLEKYPDDDFADDAEMSIQNLGKTPEELIREFEEREKNKTQI